MPLQYLIRFKESHLLVQIEERGSRRILYWDTLQAIASDEDRGALSFFRKIILRYTRSLETASFQQIDVPLADAPECLSLLAKTGRARYNGAPLQIDWQIAAKLFWRADSQSHFTPFLSYKGGEIPLEACEKVFPFWALWNGQAFPFATSLSWKWIELFIQGPKSLEGNQKKRFLEEEPPIIWQQDPSIPQLFLTDATGCFANLKAIEWEKDLIEAGYLRKHVGHSQYFCPSDQTRDALELLLDVGWEIFLPDGKRLYRQTQMEWELKDAKEGIAVRGSGCFQGKTVPLRSVMEGLQKGRLWVEIDGKSAGLLDRKKGLAIEGEWIGEALTMGRSKAVQLIPLLEAPSVSWEEALLKTVRGLKEGGESQVIHPGSPFSGELLPHQQKGLGWLDFLYRNRFGGLLADEMGLGKTVQVLAFFSRLETNLPILIVAPSSLLYHWKAEIERFLPGSDPLVYTGDANRGKFAGSRYVIVSYARLRLDEELLCQTEWEVIVLDESNAIKTAATQTAKAACRLKGRFRIALSGTPMENRTEEIQSQFQFLMPGFIQNAQTDIRKIKPFILRRKKDQLDLPEKMEHLSWIEMEAEQKALYESYLQGIQGKLLKKVASDGASAHRMEILEAILRLRQICADPRLVGAESSGAKIERLLLDVEEALSEKRKVLIYSQFTSMLALIKKELRHPCLYLDGTVAPKERAERVKAFQEDPEIPLFLLSLKAGGVGLNLTAADYVLLFDPWWNEAVENQAIDRVHRIGQKKSVIAKRYIIPSTIEEKMMQLKAQKTSAADALLDGTEDFSWTEEDLLHLLS